MAYEITLGRTEDEEKELGKRGMIFFGKKYVTMGKTTSMGNDVLLDVTKPHVMLISGKRGSGKCILPDNRVATGEGYVRSKEIFNRIKEGGEIVDKNEKEELIKAEETLKLISLNKNLKESKKEVSHAYRKKVKEELIQITTRSGRKLTVTKEHPLMTGRGPKWEEAVELKEREKIGTRGESKVRWEKIRKIEKVKYEGWVYDFTVPDTHNFIAENIICHNSYTMAAMAEGMAKLPKEVRKNLGMVMIDPLGIYWTTKYPNYRQEELLEDWDMEPQDFKDKVKVVVPYGKREGYEDVGVPVDESFSLKTASLSGGEWCSTFGIELTEPYGILISRVIRRLKEKGEDYSISDIKTEVEKDERASKREKDAVINFFEAAESWGLFKKKGKTLKDLVDPGKITIIDISTYAHLGGFSVRSLVVGLLVRKMMEERMKARRVEEMAAVERGWRVFESEEYEKKEEEQIPLIWLFLDEAHEFIAMESEGMTPSTEPLRTAIREGRQPGVSIVMATQQPGKIHSDVLTQSDIVLSHRLTAKLDIEALQEIMQTYLAKSIKSYIDQLPDRKGAAIVLDDKQERIYPIQVRPRYTWHGGREPSAIEVKKEIGEL